MAVSNVIHTQLALCEMLVAVALVATGCISLAKILIDNAQAKNVSDKYLAA